MKSLLTLTLALFPAIASAESTTGYSYGFGNDIAGIIFVGVLVMVAIIFIIWKRRKGRK